MTRLLTTYLRPYRAWVFTAMGLLLIQAIGSLYLPELNADIINNGVAKGDVDYILTIGAVMLGVTLLVGILSIVGVYFSSRASMSFGRDLRGAIFRRVASFAQTEINTFGTASLITRNTNDVQQIQTVVLMSLNILIFAPLMGIGGIIMAIRQDAPLSGTLVVIVPAISAFLGALVSRALPMFVAMQKKVDRINQVVRETLSGVRVIRAFVRDGFEQRRFDAANVDLTQTATKVLRLFTLMWPVLMGGMNLSMVAVVWLGGHRVASGAMPIGNLTAFLNYLTQILFSVMMATFMLTMVPRAAASAARIQEVLGTAPAVVDPVSPISPAGRAGCLEFRDVEFRYPGAEDAVLKHISFSAGPGETTAIVGSTGSGKSTLINLIPRFYDVTGGSVLVDGVDVRQMAQEDLWKRIGFIPQRAFLFSGTVASNLRYGSDLAGDDELWRALHIAQGADFVTGMPGQLKSEITQGGANVSGGERQRLAIARAIVRRPEIYVFDDSFSALDFRTDARLRAALADETRASTVVIVAQRVSTIMHADRIVVLDEGRIAGIGTHDGLMRTCVTYREIVYSQLTAEEIA